MLSFRDFLGLASGDKVPDEKTIWAFKEELTKKGLFEQLFDEFYAFLEENNLIMQETINRKNSKLRVRVEHVFEYMEECLHGMSSRVVGFARNAAFNTLTNLIYNLCRYEQVMRLGIN